MVASNEKVYHNPTGYSQIVEEEVNGAVTRRYTLGHWIISETQNINGTWATSFYGYDGHNSVRFPTNAAGTVTDNYTFDAFGIKIAGAGTTPNQILYSGEYLDLGTGNYDLRNRIYRQNTRTFLTADTTPGQLPYVYTADNPVMFADPSGHDFTIADITVSFAINSAITAGLDVAGNVFLGQDKSFGEIVVDSLLGGALGAIGGPIAGEFAGEAIARLGGYLAKAGAAEAAIKIIGEAVARGLFGATYTTVGVWTEYFFEHPNAPMGAKATLAVFLSSAAVSSLGSAVAEQRVLAPWVSKMLGGVNVGPEVQAMLNAVATGDFVGAAELADNVSVQDFWQQAVPRLLASNVAVGDFSGSVLVAFADRIVDFLDGLALPGLQ